MIIHEARLKETKVYDMLVKILCLDQNIPRIRKISEALVARQHVPC